MVGASNLKALHPPQVFFPVKLPPSSSSSSSSMEIKTLIQTLICRVLRALSIAKTKTLSLIAQAMKDKKPMQLIYPAKRKSTSTITKKIKNRNKKVIFGSFRLHYNFFSNSSHVLPVPAPVYDGLPESHLYYDSTWNSVVPSEPLAEECTPESELSGYLQWLEEKVQGKASSTTENNIDRADIDKLADLFIASCHEKFILEKQESCRRFQEMLARSM
ncbi:hypothetical protein UlMin_005163 [Ulmus minor]